MLKHLKLGLNFLISPFVILSINYKLLSFKNMWGFSKVGFGNYSSIKSTINTLIAEAHLTHENMQAGFYFLINSLNKPAKNPKTVSTPDEAAKIIQTAYRKKLYNRKYNDLSFDIPAASLLRPDYANRPLIDEAKYEQYVRVFPVGYQEALRVFRPHINRITFDKLLKKIDNCLRQLAFILSQKDITSGTLILVDEPSHSQGWVNDLIIKSLTHLTQKKIVRVPHAVHNDLKSVDGSYVSDQKSNIGFAEEIKNRLLADKHATVIYFDDASYSGTQLATGFIYLGILAVCRYLSCSLDLEKVKNSEINIYVCVPFMTTKAYSAAFSNAQLFLSQEEYLALGIKINFKIITTEIMPIIDQLPIRSDYKKKFCAALHIGPNKTLSITDWKIPDFLSFPDGFRNWKNRPTYKEGENPAFCSIPFLPEDGELEPYKRIKIRK